MFSVIIPAYNSEKTIEKDIGFVAESDKTRTDSGSDHN